MRELFLLLLPVLACANSTTTSAADLVLADQPSVLKSDPIEFQLNFNRDAPKGVDAAAEISQKVIQQQPTFGLHDSAGISQASYFAVLMLDTTDPSFSILHYLQGEFQADGRTKADLTSRSKPLVSYHAPGTLGEELGERHYSFLLYEQGEGAGLNYDTSLPLVDGFDQDLFEDENGLSSPIAGLAISVDIDADYDGGDEDHSPETPPATFQPPQTSPDRSITTTKVIGASDSSGPTQTTTSKRSIPSLITVSGVVISGYTPDAIPFTTSTSVISGVPGQGGKAMVTAGGASTDSTAGAAPAAGFPRRGSTDGFGSLALMATIGSAITIAIVLM